MDRDKLEIPRETMEDWQEMADLIAKIIGVPAGLIMRLTGDEIEVFLSSRTEGNPYGSGDKEHLPDSGLYCERVINTKSMLHVPDATADPEWADNPDIRLGMISYLGYPILLPDGVPFGTICVLDNRANEYSELYVKLLGKMRAIIQSQLALVYMNQELGDSNRKLSDYIREISTLRDLIPICSYCKKIRNDEGYWEKVEDYMFKHAGTSFTHGICPDCYDKVFNESFKPE